MLIYLPPSEGKTPPRAADAAAPLDLESLVFPELRAERERVIEALIAVSQSPQAQKTLKVGASVMDEVQANLAVRSGPTAPAHELYTGVLFNALDAAGMDEAARERARHCVLIFSGLFGVTGFDDLLPTHRLSMGVTLAPSGQPGAPGRLSTFWRGAMGSVLDQHCAEELIVDCRSSTYATVHRPQPEQTLVVNNLTDVDGRRTVVTHFAKHARGTLAGMLLRAEREPETIEDVAEIASAQWAVELRPAQGRTPHQLDLITV